MKDPKNIYRTTDLYLAAYIALCDGIILKDTEIIGNNKCNFIFESDKSKIEDLVHDFHFDVARVSPKLYKNKLKDLKSLALD